MMNSEKGNLVGSQGKASRSYDYNLEEEEKYLDRELVVGFFYPRGKETKV